MKNDCKPEFSFTFILFVCLSYFLICNGRITAQPFGPQNVLSAGRTNNAGQIEIIDINSDGLPDVVTSCDLGLTWFENTGEGNFNFQAFIFSQYPLCDFGFADFNGDYNPDLLIAQADSNMLCWSPGNGTANFDSVIILNGDSLAPGNLVICDLDMDLNTDFLVSYSPYHRSAWYHNDGAGNFMKNELNSVPYYGKVTGTWDFDSDLDPDLLICSNEGLTVLENNGSGIFIHAHPVVGFWPGEHQTTGDLDGDGDKDLVLFDGYGDELIWIENTGSLLTIITHSIGNQYGVRATCLADFDLDDDLDIVSGTYASGLSVFENLGMGVFDKVIEEFDDAIVPAVGASDLDQDGYPDLVMIYGQGFYRVGEQVNWFKGFGNLTFDEQEPLTSVTNSPCFAVSADLNGDLEQDIITVSSWDRKIGWFRNIGYHDYSSYELITDTLINVYGCESASGGVLADDLDLDGDIDLIAYSCHTYVLLNDGTGMFSNSFEFGFHLDEVLDVCLEDLDNDGYNDLVAACYEGIKAFRNNGDATFTATYLFPVYWPNSSATTGDIDGDGDPDIIFSERYTKKIGYALNDGNGEFPDFGYIKTINTSHYFGKIRAADLDNDGDLDILFSYEDKLVWFEQMDDSWGDEQIIIPQDINDYCTAEVDGDNDPDILYTIDSQIIWLANDGSGNFSEGKIITDKALGRSRVFTFDPDNDTDPDIISTSADEAKTAWYENLRLPVSLPELSGKEELIIVYPLPARDILHIRINSGKIQEINILDIAGKNVLHLDYSSEINQVVLNIINLKPGVYFLECTNDRGLQIIKKIVII
jgi:hypothetical protein